MAHISEAGVKMICEICDRYANEKTPLMMILSDIQNEYGYIPLDVQIQELSIANRQLIAICRALALDAKVLFMDEPTTAQ